MNTPGNCSSRDRNAWRWQCWQEIWHDVGTLATCGSSNWDPTVLPLRWGSAGWSHASCTLFPPRIHPLVWDGGCDVPLPRTQWSYTHEYADCQHRSCWVQIECSWRLHPQATSVIWPLSIILQPSISIFSHATPSASNLNSSWNSLLWSYPLPME